MNCKISVIVPVYKVKDRIVNTLECLKNQTFKNFEVLFIDDGSPDDSCDFAIRYLNGCDVNYKVIKKENGGVSSARNLGIERAQGKYITFLDSDDYIENDMLEAFYEKAENENADVVYSAYVYEDNNKEAITSNAADLTEGIYDGMTAAIGLAYGTTYTHIMANMFKTSLLKENNIKFDTNRKFAEDISFMLKAYGHADKIYCIDKVCAHYVRWSQSAMNNIKISYLDVYYSNIETLKYIKENFNNKLLENAMVTSRIPAAIVNIFIAFCTKDSLKNELKEFLGDKKVRAELRKYKMARLEKDRLRYLILSKIILICPKIIEKYYNKKKQ